MLFLKESFLPWHAIDSMSLYSWNRMPGPLRDCCLPMSSMSPHGEGDNGHEREGTWA
jgi:hypothetical protein